MDEGTNCGAHTHSDRSKDRAAGYRWEFNATDVRCGVTVLIVFRGDDRPTRNPTPKPTIEPLNFEVLDLPMRRTS